MSWLFYWTYQTCSHWFQKVTLLYHTYRRPRFVPQLYLLALGLRCFYFLQDQWQCWLQGADNFNKEGGSASLMRDMSCSVRLVGCVPCSCLRVTPKDTVRNQPGHCNLCTPLGSSLLHKECWVPCFVYLSVGLYHCLCPCLNLVMVLSESSTFWKCTACCIRKSSFVWKQV